MQRIGHISRLLLVVLAVLVCQGAAAELVNPEPCGVLGFLAGQLGVGFESGTSIDRAEEILAEFDVHVIRFVGFPFRPFVLLCVPLGITIRWPSPTTA